MKNYFTLEYSPLQKCFHYDQISEMIQHNMNICARKSPKNLPGFICIGIFETEQDRQKMKDKIQEALNLKSESLPRADCLG